MAVIVLTGASAGIGAAAAIELTRQGHQVVASGRSADKLRSVHEQMSAVAPPGIDVPEPIPADLSSFAEVRRLAHTIIERFATIDVLANNAGMTTARRQVSVEGIEAVFAVNHLAAFLLTNLLLERLQGSGGRVVTTASAVHRMGRIDFEDLQLERGWSRMGAYARSKLANILFTAELRRRSRLATSCFHPGTIATDLWRDTWMGRTAKLFGGFMRSPQRGADTLVWLATSEEGGSPTGLYYIDRKPAKPAETATDPSTAARLWTESAVLVGLSA